MERKTKYAVGLWIVVAFFAGAAMNDYYQIPPAVAETQNCGVVFPKTVLGEEPTNQTVNLPLVQLQPADKPALVAPAALDKTDWKIGKVLKVKDRRCAWLRKGHERWVVVRLPPSGEAMSFATREQALGFAKAGWCS